MKSLAPEVVGAVIAHPVHQTNRARIEILIEQLRSCKEPADYNEFQRHLFKAVYEIEERRSQCSRIVKRLRKGESLPVDRPALSNDSDPSVLATWEFELFVYERLARQLRTVGDGLAWRCFGYDRRLILALSRNESPGMMYGKEGLPFELGRVNHLWEDRGHFTLLHDLTNCLRIADLSEFTADGGILLHEVKKNPQADRSAQMKRIEAAVNAVMHGGTLPGDQLDARLVELTEPYVVNLKQLNDLLQLAKQHGCRGMRLPQGRALFATSIPDNYNRWKGNPDAGMAASDSARLRAIKRAGIDKAMHHIQGFSGDTAARSPIMAPWSIYPFSSEDCSALICDLLGFQTILSVDALVDSLTAVGLHADILLNPADGDLSGDKKVLRAWLDNRSLTLHAEGLNVLLYELLEPDAWARGVLETLSVETRPGSPGVVFADEAASWL